MSGQDTPIAVAAAIIWRDGHYLGVCRPQGKPMAGKYEFPGGKIEPGETPAAALARELREELGITPSEFAFYREKAHAYDTFLVRLYFFHVHAFTGALRALEGQDMEWLTPDEALARPFLEADRDIVMELARGFDM